MVSDFSKKSGLKIIKQVDSWGSENEYNCKDTAEINIVIHPLPEIITSNDTLICVGDTANIFAWGGNTYVWNPAGSLTNPEISNPGASPLITTLYTVIGADQYGCTNSNSLLITVQQMPYIYNISADTAVIIGESVKLKASFLNGMTFYWSPDINISSIDSLEPIALIEEDIIYTFSVIDSNQCFTITHDVNIEVILEYSVDLPTAFVPESYPPNNIIKVRGWGIFNLIEFRIYNRLSQVVFKTENIDEGWDGTYKGKKQPAGTYGYIVIVESYDGQLRTKTGSFLLLR